MKTWTEQAEQRLGEYLEERVRREGFEGEDAHELKSDLISHIHEEAEKEQTDSIGLMQLEKIFGHLDAGYQPPGSVPPFRDRSHGLPPDPPKRTYPRGTFFFGVILPLLVILIEVVTGFCGGAFFNPIPTWWHVALVSCVPLINLWLLKGAPRGSERGKGIAAAFARVIAVFYGLLFLPLLPASLFAVILLGMGLLSLSPVLAAIYTWWLGRKVRRESSDRPAFRFGRRIGVFSALAILLLLEGPALWTRANLSLADGTAKDRQGAIERLRFFRSDRTLLLACYQRNQGMREGTDVSGWMIGCLSGLSSFMEMGSFPGPGSEAMRDIFFRVTGKPFDSIEPPRMIRSGGLDRGRGGDFREMEVDRHVGSDQVALRLKDLDLAESRFDGHVDARSRTGYGEWTMVFHNASSRPQEARCQVLLPRGGCVSRLTLWVNGEPREAAFNSVQKVKAAYKQVAVVQRQDPVLVTMAAPDTVLVQCFPVPANGEMKIRFGITAPLDGELWELPRIIERNFGTADALEHAVWLQGDKSFRLLEEGQPERNSVTDGPGQSMTLTLSSGSAMSHVTVVRLVGSPSSVPPGVWCEDKFASDAERYLIREPKPVHRIPAGPVLLVIDGSLSMEKEQSWITAALQEFVPGDPFELLLADDTARPISLKDLKPHRFSGGRDNEPALREAIRRAKAGEVGDIVWLHGPQAVGLAQTEALLQLIERGTRQPVIHSVATSSGPNRLAEVLQRSGAILRGPTLLNPKEDLSAFLHRLTVERDDLAWHWQRSPTPPSDLGPPVWDHLARQWAIEAVESSASEVPEESRPALAARYQLVTRVSGAVVLETQAQYDQNGLSPVDPSAAPKIPGVPEPSTSLLLMISATLGILRRRRPAHEVA